MPLFGSVSKSMYLHLGQDIVVHTKNIIGIFDLEKATLSKSTKEFLSSATKKGNVITVSYEMPKSFIITEKDNMTFVYISQISTATLKKRSNLKTINLFVNTKEEQAKIGGKLSGE